MRLEPAVWTAVLFGCQAVTVGAGPASSNAVDVVEIDVTAERVKAADGMYGMGETAAAALSLTPGIWMNSQGGSGAQNDLSIRGSSFSGAGLSVEGLSLRNPQTEHHHAELPLSPRLFNAPRVRTGMDQAMETDGFLVGTADLGIAPLSRGGRLDMGGGQYNRNWQNALWTETLGRSAGGLRGGVGLFAGREVADRLDYEDNDLDSIYGGAQLQALGDDTQGDLLFGAGHKTFGARGYYGVRPDWAAEEELDDLLVLGRWRRGDAADSFVRFSAAYRALQDEYRLYWTYPGVYENRHVSRVATAAVDGRSRWNEAVSLRWRAGADDERMDSNLLGNQDRQHAPAMAAPEWRGDGFTVQAGVKGEAFSDDKPAVLPLCGIQWGAAERMILFADYVESVRQPSYTELNYDSPGSLGNQGLERQHLRSGEAGIRGPAGDRITWRAAVFVQRSYHTVDWVRETPESGRWVATDLGTVDTSGLEAQVDWEVAREFNLGVHGVALDRSSDADVYAGRYVLDYGEFAGRVLAAWKAGRRLRVDAAQGLRRQTENPLRESGRTALDAMVGVRYIPWIAKRTVELYARVENLWDEDFEVYPGQPVAGRRVSGGVTISW